MKILHVIANLATRYGGPSQAVLGMTQSLAKMGNDVTVYTTNQDGDGVLDVPLDKPVMTNGVKIQYFQIQSPRFFGTSMPMAKALQKNLKEKKFDIVHIHSLYLFHGAVAAHYCRMYNIPYVIKPHGSLDPFLYRRSRAKKALVEFLFENRNIRHAKALIYTTEEEKQLARPFISHGRSFIVPNGLYVEEYTAPADGDRFRDKFPETKGKKVILFFSRLNFKKGLDLLVQAYADVAKRNADVHLVVTGPDNEGYGDIVRGWIREAGIEDRVTFTGMLTGQDKLDVLKAADMFALPSYSENFGIAVIEAMICGIPVIISNKVNIYRELVDHHAGLVVNCDASELSDGIQKLLDDPDYAHMIGENGRQLVENRFQWSKVGQTMHQSYEVILKG